MAALTAERSTLAFDSAFSFPLPAQKVKAGVKIWKGSLVVLDAGFAKPGIAAAALVAIGRAEETVDNTGGADGDLLIEVHSGIYAWDNKSGDLLTEALVGTPAYIEDDQTVRLTAGGTSKAGTVVQVDSSPPRVWVGTVYPAASL